MDQNKEGFKDSSQTLSNGRVLSPYSYIKQYNKVADSTTDFRQNSIKMKIYPLNKIKVPLYLEKEHAKQEEFRQKYQNIGKIEYSQKDDDETKLAKRTENLLVKIAENNKKQEQAVISYRTHKPNGIPFKIVKNEDQIDFIDNTQKKYFSVTKQYMLEINKHKALNSSPQQNNITKNNGFYSLNHTPRTPQKKIATFSHAVSNLLDIQSLKSSPRNVEGNKKKWSNSPKIISQNNNLNLNTTQISRRNSSAILELKHLSQNNDPLYSLNSTCSKEASGFSDPPLMCSQQLQYSSFHNSASPSSKMMMSSSRGSYSHHSHSYSVQVPCKTKDDIEERYQKKMDYILKNKNPQFYMSSTILNRRNLSLRKILSSIPEKKLLQIYQKKHKDFQKLVLQKANNFPELLTCEPKIRPKFKSSIISAAKTVPDHPINTHHSSSSLKEDNYSDLSIHSDSEKKYLGKPILLRQSEINPLIDSQIKNMSMSNRNNFLLNEDKVQEKMNTNKPNNAWNKVESIQVNISSLESENFSPQKVQFKSDKIAQEEYPKKNNYEKQSPKKCFSKNSRDRQEIKIQTEISFHSNEKSNNQNKLRMKDWTEVMQTAINRLQNKKRTSINEFNLTESSSWSQKKYKKLDVKELSEKLNNIFDEKMGNYQDNQIVPHCNPQINSKVDPFSSAAQKRLSSQQNTTFSYTQMSKRTITGTQDQTISTNSHIAPEPSLFDFNKYFHHKYTNNYKGFSLSLSKGVENQNKQFENQVIQFINDISQDPK